MKTKGKITIDLTTYQAILVRSLEILSSHEETLLDKLMDKDSTTTQDVLAFLKSKIPTFDLLLKEEQLKSQEPLQTFSFM